MRYLVLMILAIQIMGCDSGKNENETQGPPQDSVSMDFNDIDDEIVADSTLIELNDSIREKVNDPDLYLKRSARYFALQDPTSAVQDIDRAYRLDTTYLPTLLAQADYFLNRGKLDESMAILQKAMNYHPESSKLYEKLSELYLIGQDNNKSIEYADLAIKYDIYNANAYFLKGYNFLEKGDTAKAISSYRTAIEQDPDYFEVYIELATLYALKDNPLALDYYNNALSINPNDPNALYGKAMYQQEHEMLNEAMATYTHAIKSNPSFREAYYNMGYLHMYYLKLYREGMKYFTQAIEVDPNYYQAYYNRGYSFELMGDINNAAKDYRMSLKIRPDYDLAANGLERVTADLPQ